MIGTLQAVEAVKCLLDQGDLFTNRLLVYNALRGSFRTMTVGRSPDCPLCGDEPSITELRDEVQPERCDLAPRTCPSPAPQKEA